MYIPGGVSSSHQRAYRHVSTHGADGRLGGIAASERDAGLREGEEAGNWGRTWMNKYEDVI